MAIWPFDRQVLLRVEPDGDRTADVQLPPVAVAVAVVPHEDERDHATATILRLPERRCKVHGSLLLDKGHDGRELADPTCLECLPPHQPDCPQGDMMAKVEVLATHGLVLRYDRELAAMDISKSAFRRYFGSARVPACACANRELGFSTSEQPVNPTQPALRTSDAPTLSPWVFTDLTRRFQTMMFHDTKDLAYIDMTLGDPLTHQPGIEAHAGPDAETAWKRLVRFEMQERRSAKRRR